MAINNKFVHFKTSAKFKEQLEAGNIKDTSVCFIKDTNQIYTHGQYYDCSELTDEKVVGSSLVGYAESQETNEALDLSSSDTIISAFGKLVKAIKDNEEVESTAFVKLRDSIGLDENLNYETGGGSSISEDIEKLKGSQVGKFDPNSKTGELFNNAISAGLNAHAEGNQTKADGESSHSEGMGCVANGVYNHVEGYKNTTDGHSSHAEGYQNTITENGNASHAEGRENNISSMCAHAEGQGNTVSGNGAHVEGWSNTASGDGAHVEGKYNIVNTLYSHAEGAYNIINGDTSHAEGGSLTNVYLTGDGGGVRYEVFSEASWLCQSLTQKELFDYFNYKNSYIIDYELSTYSPIKIIEAEYDSERDIVFITLEKTVSSEPISNKRYGIGRNLINEGAYSSHIEGCSNAINDNCSTSHIENNDNSIVSGTSCHMEGVLNFIKNGDICHVEGFCNTAQNQAEHAQGTYNLSNTGDTDDKKTLHSVGIGVKGARKNAHEIMRNGDQYIIGVGGYDGTNPETAKTIQEIINSGSSESNYALFNLEDFFTNEYIVGPLREVIFSNTTEKVNSSTTNEINIENVRKLLDAYNNNKIILLKITYAGNKTCIVQCQLSYYDSPFGKQLLLNFGSNVYPSVNDDGSIVDHKVSILFRFDRINSLQNEAYYRGISLELNRKNDLFSSVLTGEGFYRYLGEMRLNKYSKVTSYSELSLTDSLQEMIGKLDAKYGNKEDGGTGEIIKTLSPNVFYQFGEVTSLTLTLGNEISGIYNEYMFQFTCGATPATLGLPDDIKWLNGEAPTIEANKTYQVSIVNKLAVIGEF